jgi:hypothetical protein
MRRRDGLCPKRVKNGESLSLLLLLAVRRMRREHTRRMSKAASDACQLEGLWTFHHCFLDILAACFLKRCVNPITGRFCLSSVVSSALHPSGGNSVLVGTPSRGWCAGFDGRSLGDCVVRSFPLMVVDPLGCSETWGQQERQKGPGRQQWWERQTPTPTPASRLHPFRFEHFSHIERHERSIRCTSNNQLLAIW